MLVAPQPANRAFEGEADRMIWVEARGAAPSVLASGRVEVGTEALVVQLAAEGVPAGSGRHGVDPSDVASLLAEALRLTHQIPAVGCPYDSSVGALRDAAAERVVQGHISVPDSGPYQRKEPQELLTVLDDLLDDQRESDLAVIHGAPTLDNMWLVPDGPALLTGWASAGAGDRHRDLAVGVRSLIDHYGPALVAPFLDNYGLETVDVRRLDTHQLLDFLLT